MSTSLKFHFRPSTKKAEKGEVPAGKLFIRIIHQRKMANISTDYKIYPQEWDCRKQELILPENNLKRFEYLLGILEKMNQDLESLKEIVSKLSSENGGEYTAKDIAGCFRKKSGKSNTLMEYCLQVKSMLEMSRRDRMARAYHSAVKSLYTFTQGKDVLLMDINARLMNDYEMYLSEKKLKLNTISFYMRNIRVLYNRAIEENLIRKCEENPFKKVYTGVAESEKRALNTREVKKIAELEREIDKKIDLLKVVERKDPNVVKSLKYNLKLKKSLFFFLFCYHARGMSFVDLSYLRKTDIQGDMIIYKRKKTGGCLKVKITEPMKQIIEYFSKETIHSKYVFPIISEKRGNERRQYESGLNTQNVYLGYLSKLAGLSRKITTHVARHTWATLAKQNLNISIAVISEALGHKDIKTTDRYLASFEPSVLNSISEKMSKLIRHKSKVA